MVADTQRLVSSREGGADPTTRIARPGAVLRWVARTQCRAIMLWSIAVAAVSGIYASFWDVIDADDMAALAEGMPEGLAVAMGYDRIGTASGYLEASVYGMLAAILLIVFGVGFAARTIAGLEEEGSLELELTSPIGRRQVVLERYAALVLQLALLAAAVTAVVIVLGEVVDMGIGVGGFLAAGLGLLLLGLAIASVSFAVGAATGRRVLAVAVGAGVAVVGYLADALAPLLDDGRWLEVISPFSWYLGNEPLLEGVDVPGFGALLVVALLALGVAIVTFDRRDLGV